MKPVICFHHNDLDGYCSAAIVKLKHPNVALFEMNYNTQIVWGLIHPDDKVYIVDFRFPLEDMRKLLSITPDVTWIDHHKTAIDLYEGFPIEIDGIRSTESAACLLTWSHLFAKDWSPEAVRLISEYDTTGFKCSDRAKYLGTALHARNCRDIRGNFYAIWSVLLDGDTVKAAQGLIQMLVKEGEVLEGYRSVVRSEIIDNHYEIDFFGYRCLVLNSSYDRSFLGCDLLNFDCDIAIVFNYNGKFKKWVFSIYTNNKDIDVSKLAAKFGGGGHPGASGFSCKDLSCIGVEV